MKNKKYFITLLQIARPTQWVKNLSLFATVIFNGQLFHWLPFSRCLLATIAFCLLSSFSYIVNDIIDAPFDRQHPTKKYRPVANGSLSSQKAFLFSLLFLISGLILTFSLGINLFLVACFFVLLHLAYSLVLKKTALYDIVTISLSFIIRAVAGEIATGYPLPIWLTLTIVFLSLFIASGKRFSELETTGTIARQALKDYQWELLHFYLSVFAVATLITYTMFTFTTSFAFPTHWLKDLLSENFPQYSSRKWFMLTLFPVIFGIMRYGQLIFVKQKGERPEKLLTADIPLLITVSLWGTMVIFFIYVF